MSYAASGMIFQDYRRVPVSVFMIKTPVSEPLKMVTGIIFEN
jgi:hypothetical protein